MNFRYFLFRVGSAVLELVELLMSVVTNDKYSVVSKENAVGTLLSIANNDDKRNK